MSNEPEIPVAIRTSRVAGSSRVNTTIGLRWAVIPQIGSRITLMQILRPSTKREPALRSIMVLEVTGVMWYVVLRRGIEQRVVGIPEGAPTIECEEISYEETSP